MDAKSLYAGQLSSIAHAPPSATSPRDRALVEVLRARLEGRADASLAELSVGDGALSYALARAFPRLRLTLVDISRAHLEGARAIIGHGAPAESAENIELVEADLDRDFARLPSDRYDVVLALDVLEHVFDVFGFVAHCRRILAPGGTLALRVPNLAYLRHRLALAVGRLPVTSSWFGARDDLTAWRERYGWDGGHLHYFTWPTLRRLLADAGFDDLRATDLGARLAPVRALWPGLLCGNLLVLAKRVGA